MLSKKLKVMFWDSWNVMTENAANELNAGVHIVNIPVGKWHSSKLLEYVTMIFEAKEDPYTSRDVVSVIGI